MSMLLFGIVLFSFLASISIRASFCLVGFDIMGLRVICFLVGVACAITALYCAVELIQYVMAMRAAAITVIFP